MSVKSILKGVLFVCSLSTVLSVSNLVFAESDDLTEKVRKTADIRLPKRYTNRSADLTYCDPQNRPSTKVCEQILKVFRFGQHRLVLNTLLRKHGLMLFAPTCLKKRDGFRNRINRVILADIKYAPIFKELFYDTLLLEHEQQKSAGSDEQAPEESGFEQIVFEANELFEEDVHFDEGLEIMKKILLLFSEKEYTFVLFSIVEKVKSFRTE